MTYRPIETHRRDIWGPLVFMAIGLLIVLSLGGCAYVRRDQIEKDSEIVKSAMFTLQNDIKNPYDQNQVRNARHEILEKLVNQ